jgi:hypothetical protein
MIPSSLRRGSREYIENWMQSTTNAESPAGLAAAVGQSLIGLLLLQSSSAAVATFLTSANAPLPTTHTRGHRKRVRKTANNWFRT